MNEVTPIKQPANKDAIDILETAIERVEAGEIVGVSLSWITKDQSIGGRHSSSDNQILIWASMEHSARQFYDNVVMGED